MLLVLYLGIPPLSLAAGLKENEALPQTCHDVVMDSLIIYQPDDALLRNYAPYHKRIRVLFDYLAANPSVGLRLEGNTDSRKSSEYSFALGQRYADDVKKYLVSQGFEPDRIIALSNGKEKPVDSGHNRTAWAKNRRVDVKLRCMDEQHGNSDSVDAGPRP